MAENSYTDRVRERDDWKHRYKALVQNYNALIEEYNILREKIKRERAEIRDRLDKIKLLAE